ncbi:peptidase M15 [Thalassotalea euphylliae]|uniref:peptidase M15 n=1 Tax=Thalassotalea euphylliae TaxID=1655234 RepID=UPI001C6E11AE|nr:peptidase M15 [Thalassotalea euphylliae]
MSKHQITKLDTITRTRLSANFFLRDFLFSETAVLHGVNNIPDDIELAIAAGSQLCEQVLEPIQQAWGRIHIRSAFRSCEVNQLGNTLGANCASNESNYASHIWDRRDAAGFMGATACIVIPAYLDYYQKTGDWASLAWWVHANIPAYQHMFFFPSLCAFNISWHENQNAPQTISSYVIDPNTGHKKRILTAGVASEYYQKIPLAQRYAACETLLSKMEP